MPFLKKKLVWNLERGGREDRSGESREETVGEETGNVLFVRFDFKQHKVLRLILTSVCTKVYLY